MVSFPRMAVAAALVVSSSPAMGAFTVLTITDPSPTSALGFAVTSCDFDSDGTPDIVLTDTGDSIARVFNGIDGMEITSFTAANPGGVFGVAVACADLDDDGTPDVLVSELGHPTLGSLVHAFDGAPDPGQVRLELDGWPVVEPLSIGFGNSIATGDTDGDGDINVVVGDPSFAGTDGQVHVFDSQGANELIISGTPGSGENFGISVDVGETGLASDSTTSADILVGAPLFSSRGEARVFGFDENLPASYQQLGATGTMFIGDERGFSVAFFDHDGDGFQDLAVGAPGAGPLSGPATGAVHVFTPDGSTLLGSAFGDSDLDRFGDFVANAFDLDGDGTEDLVATAFPTLSSLPYTRALRSRPGDSQPLDRLFQLTDFGGAAVAGVPDLTADGWSEVVVSDIGTAGAVVVAPNTPGELLSVADNVIVVDAAAGLDGSTVFYVDAASVSATAYAVLGAFGTTMAPGTIGLLPDALFNLTLTSPASVGLSNNFAGLGPDGFNTVNLEVPSPTPSLDTDWNVSLLIPGMGFTVDPLQGAVPVAISQSP